MPRAPRVDYPGAWHHVMHRGARRERIFTDARHCWTFLDTVGEAVDRFGVEVHAYALMPNHYHLLIRSVDRTLSRALQHINGTYTQRLNRREGWDGPVFRGRFRSQLIEDDDALRYVFAYIHLNPVRANLVTRPDAEDDNWTSYRTYVRGDPPPPWLRMDTMLERLGGAAGLEAFTLTVHRKSDPWPLEMDLETGLLRVVTPSGNVEPAADRDEPHVPPTSVADCLARIERTTGVGRSELMRVQRGPRANPARRFAVWALGHATTLTHAAIGEELGMSATAVAKVLARTRIADLEGEVGDWKDAWLAEDLG